MANDTNSGERLYYIQDTRQVVGNCVLWWRAERAGYTCDLSDAGLYTEEARRITRLRGTDIAWPRELVESLVIKHVRFEPLQDRKGEALKP